MTTKAVTCSTTGCTTTADHQLTWDNLVTEPVCTDCAVSYAARPAMALKVWISPLPAQRVESSCEYSERPSAVYAAYCDDNHCACERCQDTRDAL